jgi:hypothetical protein
VYRCCARAVIEHSAQSTKDYVVVECVVERWAGCRIDPGPESQAGEPMKRLAARLP